MAYSFAYGLLLGPRLISDARYYPVPIHHKSNPVSSTLNDLLLAFLGGVIFLPPICGLRRWYLKLNRTFWPHDQPQIDPARKNALLRSDND